MESEKVKEIKNALYCCTTEELLHPCEECPYTNDCKCEVTLHTNILTLINELEEENIGLKNQKKEFLSLISGQENIISELGTENQQLKDRIAELEKENEKIKNIGLNEEITVREYLREMQRLKDRVDELEKGNEALSAAVNQGFNDCQSKTLKQFAERLKDRLRYTSPTSDVLELSGLVFDGTEVEQCIDETLKERTEGV